jgi:hypothetical protein
MDVRNGENVVTRDGRQKTSVCQSGRNLNDLSFENTSRNVRKALVQALFYSDEAFVLLFLFANRRSID